MSRAWVITAVLTRCASLSEETGTISAEQIVLITQHALWEYEHNSDDVVYIAGTVARLLRKRGIKIIA